MATAARAQQVDEQHPGGTVRLSPEEVEELEAADVEFEEDRAAGRVRPLSELLEELRQRRRS